MPSNEYLLIIVMAAVHDAVLGTLVDSISLMLLTFPSVLPVAREAGLDSIWFRIIVILC